MCVGVFLLLMKWRKRYYRYSCFWLHKQDTMNNNVSKKNG